MDSGKTGGVGSTLRVACEAARTPRVNQALAVFRRRLDERLGVSLVEGTEAPGPARGDVTLALEPGIGVEGFRISKGAGGTGWRIAGNDERGLIYGVGRFLRECAASGSERGWRYSGWQGVSVPALPVRGMYFATHFHNFYHEAPIEAVERYVEDLALWGCNALSVWFDMHHYAGVADPAAQAMIERLRAILRAANRVGIRAGFVSLANEAYSTSPSELRAEPFPHHYHVEVCPTRPGGLDLILKWRREMLETFADLDVGYFWIWPYDQGGCKCTDCKPWGGNGFVRNAEAVARLVREIMPRAKTVVSTWEFGYWEGDPEWDLFYAAMAKRPDWVDYLMAEGHGDFPPYILKHGPPPGYPLLNFPEISMSGMGPWGGFGANLQPRRLQKVWNSCRRFLAGGFPYSEGIYEDLNKAICLQLVWDPARPVEAIVREYAASEFAPEQADAIAGAIYALEDNMGHGVAPMEDVRKWAAWAMAPATAGDAPPVYALRPVADPAAPLAALDAAAAALTERARTSWRWRMLWLRAALDAEIRRSGGRLTDAADARFEELTRISHADRAEGCVAPPGRRTLLRWAGRG